MDRAGRLLHGWRNARRRPAQRTPKQYCGAERSRPNGLSRMTVPSPRSINPMPDPSSRTSQQPVGGKTPQRRRSRCRRSSGPSATRDGLGIPLLCCCRRQASPTSWTGPSFWNVIIPALDDAASSGVIARSPPRCDSQFVPRARGAYDLCPFGFTLSECRRSRGAL